MTFVSFLFTRCYLNRVADRFLENYYSSNHTSNYTYYNNYTTTRPYEVPPMEPMIWNASFNMRGNG